MKKIPKVAYVIAILLILAAIGATYYVMVLQPQQVFEAQNAVVRIDRPDTGLEFSYVEGPDALSLFEPSTVTEPLHSVFILVPSPQFVALRNQEEIETPPSITLFAYDKRNAYDRPNENDPEGGDLSRRDRLLRWANENDGVTGISRALAEPADIELDGLSGLFYQNEGAFKQDIYLFSYQDRIFFFVGQYQTEGDQMQQYFKDVLETVYFI
jgi:hypothetical protein